MTGLLHVGGLALLGFGTFFLLISGLAWLFVADKRWPITDAARLTGVAFLCLSIGLSAYSAAALKLL